MRSCRLRLCAVAVVLVCASLLSSCGGGRPPETLAVYVFRWQGDPDAKYYAAGFGRALADRLHCAPRCVTQQPSGNTLYELLQRLKCDLSRPIPDKSALAAAKIAGAHFAITGDLRLAGDKVTLSAYLLGTSPDSRKTTLTASGKTADLPAMQVEIVRQAVKAMNLRPGRRAARDLYTANFSKPDTLLEYGKSFITKKMDDAIALRWRMVAEDPKSEFAALRLLELYVFGPFGCRAIQKEKRLPAFVADASRRFPDNSHIDALAGYLLCRQFQYKKAEERLRECARKDPRFALAHGCLASVALERSDAGLAIDEGGRLVSLWPGSSAAHATLSDAYGCAAASARRGHYFGDMTRSMRTRWSKNNQAALREARTATELDRDNSYAWGLTLTLSRELGYDEFVERAFREMVRIEPRTMAAYHGYAFCFSPQWGGTPERQEEVFAMMDKAFGKGSAESCIVRGQVMLCNTGHDAQRPEILRLAETALKKSKPHELEALDLKCRVLIGLHRRAEMLEVAKRGFELAPSPYWRIQLAKGYQFRYEDTSDPKALLTAYNLLKECVEELPFNPYTRVELGWCLSHMGRRKEAKEQFLTALKLDPTNEMAKEKLSYVR